MSRRLEAGADDTAVAKPVELLIDGQLHVALDDACRDGVARKTGGFMEIQFGHEMLPMFVHCLGADSKHLRHSFVRASLSDKLEHFDLARTEAIPLISEPTI